eukprot:m.64656 g.64656  ORF g.64656 m.64656 type:complete len:202 (+) comp7278_c0_seq1:210-815(+)
MAAPIRTVRAIYDEHTVRVYQAYRDEIADAALAAQRFVPPFRMERMTWIKPSFNWMMHRSGYASKHGQERVLAIDITREGFEWALAHARFSQRTSKAGGAPRCGASAPDTRSQPVRVQWDPERDHQCERMQRTRAIQIGLRGAAVARYVNDWIVRIEDVTAIARAARGAPSPAGLPCEREREYPLPRELRWICGGGGDADE